MGNNSITTKFIPLARPDIKQEDIQAVINVLQSGMLVQGKCVENLEELFCKYAGSKFASALSNGTATLHLALKALQIGPGDEVIVPAFSYIATANVVEIVGATPVFVDVDADTFNIDVNKIEEVITPKTKAIIPVHEFGLACDIGKIVEIAKKNNLYIIEDAACALGAKYNGNHVGSFGDFGSFSLHPRKAISSGEGGVLLTSNALLDRKIKVLRNHGIDVIENKIEFTEFGYNYRMTDFQAALVVSQFNRLQNSIQYKNELANIYLKELKTSGIKLPYVPGYANHTWQTFHIVLDDEIDRDKLIVQLKENNIGANYGAQCIPYMRSYRRKYNLDCEHLFPNAMKAYKSGLALPLYDLLNKSELLYIIEKLNKLIS